RLFYKMPWWKKVIVMAGGPTVNLLIAFGIFVAVFATYGNPSDLRINPVVAGVEHCVVPYSESGRVCTDKDPVTPAVKAGLKDGDQIVAFNGHPIDEWTDLQRRIRANDDGAATITVVRDGQRLDLTTNT